MSTRTIVLHASDMLARAYRSVGPDRRDPSGAQVNAVYGATRALRRILSFKEPTFAVAVVDDAPPDCDWSTQRAAWHDLLNAHGVPIRRVAEPIQAVAAYVSAALALGHDVVIGGSDKRLGQLVADQVWWYEGHKDVRYTPEAIRKRFGVGPEQLADWLALVGLEDVLDGVPGIGAKGAAGLLRDHGSLQEALTQLNDVAGRAGNALRQHPDRARAQQAMATLTSGAAAEDLPSLPWQRPTAARLDGAYRALGFYTMLTGVEPDAPARVPVVSPDDIEALVRGLDGHTVALEVVTEAPSPVRGALVGLALAWGDGPAAYVPLPDDVPLALADWLSDSSPKIGHDTKRARVALARRRIPLSGIVGDTALAAHLLDPTAPNGLGRLARGRLQQTLPTEDSVLGRGKQRRAWGDVAADTVAAWAGARARASLRLWPELATEVPSALLEEALALDTVLTRMDLLGMPIDPSALTGVGTFFESLENALQGEIHQLAGHPFTITSNKQLGTVLFEELGLEVLRKTKTGWSVANEVLERIAHQHPIVPRVIRFKQLRRMRDTWVTALATHISPDHRVRSSVHGARSYSGRLITTTPDLGRTPARTPELNRIRQAFVAPPGHHLLSVDYEQLGLYVLAHLTEDPALVEPLASGADLHRATASALLDKPPEDLTADERQLGKVVNFATFAGQGASALAIQLGIEPAEAKALIKKFYQRYARVAAYQDAQLELATSQGFVVTMGGRRWPIPHLNSLEPRDRAYAERMARRASHEGSVADVTRRGLLLADRALHEAGLPAAPLVQILDEIVFEVPIEHVRATAEVAGQAMRSAFSTLVPLQVSAKAGPTWGDMTPL